MGMNLEPRRNVSVFQVLKKKVSARNVWPV